jgi:hypothetical protein
MRINVYSQELTSEVIRMPHSQSRREEMAKAFEQIAKLFRTEGR